METVYCSLLNGKFCDRGFLTLPFCTIYGFSIMAIYLLIGTPQKGGLILGKCKRGILRYILYFLAAVLIPSVAELITGAFFDRVFAIRLWNYSSYKYNLWGYVCLKFSLLWGLLITLSMAWIFPLIRKGIEKIPNILTNIMATVLAAAVCADWVICFSRI